jgi:hypothetical protein
MGPDIMKNGRQLRGKRLWRNKTHTNRVLAHHIEENAAKRQINHVHNYYDALHPHDPKEEVECQLYPPYPRRPATRQNPYGIPETGLKKKISRKTRRR